MEEIVQRKQNMLVPRVFILQINLLLKMSVDIVLAFWPGLRSIDLDYDVSFGTEVGMLEFAWLERLRGEHTVCLAQARL